MAKQRGRLRAAELPRFLSLLKDLAITIDQRNFAFTMGTTVPLAGQYKLTVYDAAYLELALREVIPLASVDKRLADACIAAGGTVLRTAQARIGPTGASYTQGRWQGVATKPSDAPKVHPPGRGPVADRQGCRGGTRPAASNLTKGRHSSPLEPSLPLISSAPGVICGSPVTFRLPLRNN